MSKYTLYLTKELLNKPLREEKNFNNHNFCAKVDKIVKLNERHLVFNFDSCNQNFIEETLVNLKEFVEETFDDAFFKHQNISGLLNKTFVVPYSEHELSVKKKLWSKFLKNYAYYLFIKKAKKMQKTSIDLFFQKNLFINKFLKRLMYNCFVINSEYNSFLKNFYKKIFLSYFFKNFGSLRNSRATSFYIFKILRTRWPLLTKQSLGNVTNSLDTLNYTALRSFLQKKLRNKNGSLKVLLPKRYYFYLLFLSKNSKSGVFGGENSDFWIKRYFLAIDRQTKKNIKKIF